jgi:hypothetical protein
MNNQQQEIDTYWNYNEVIGEGDIESKPVLIRMRLHRSTEKYFDDDTLIKLSTHKGERIYFHAKPYILIPDMTLTFALSRQPAPDGAIGEVIGADVKKLKPLEIGNAQAWYVRRIGACLDPVRSTEGSRRTKHTCFWQHP